MDGDGTVELATHDLPALEAGRYRVTARHTVAERTDEDPVVHQELSDVIELEVTGPRFTLPPERIHSRFPAPGSHGDFTEVLPHIAISSPTLPWLREPDARDRRVRSTRTDAPWMALLLFHHDDPAPQVTTGPLAELLEAREYAGWRRREAGERADDLCQWIEVEGDLFHRIAPERESLRWLTHVRREAGTEVAVVVANRLPDPRGVTTCCLVSLEDAAHILGSATRVRLPVLDSWTFNPGAEREDFKGLVERLDCDVLRLARPLPETEHGYALLEHTLRQGARTVSWYRGPLIPSATASTPEAGLGHDSADEFLRHDALTGMFDVSLAAAWQLGRLLALADPELSVAIAEFKAEGQRRRAQTSERALVADRLGGAVTTGAELQRQLRAAVLEPAAKGLADA